MIPRGSDQVDDAVDGAELVGVERGVQPIDPAVAHVERGDPVRHAVDADHDARGTVDPARAGRHVVANGSRATVEALDRVLVAASAIIAIFGFKDWEYFNLTNVILYPDTFDESYQYEGNRRNILGIVGSGPLNGQMILSRSALREGFSDTADKNNTAIHEFVHLLDKTDGYIDGLPSKLLEHSYSIPWMKLVHQTIQAITDGHTDINPYGAINEAEFFAVISEYFFERPDLLAEKHPELYEMLTRIFRQDPGKAGMGVE